jgi:hypothetical protein
LLVCRRQALQRLQAGSALEGAAGPRNEPGIKRLDNLVDATKTSRAAMLALDHAGVEVVAKTAGCRVTMRKKLGKEWEAAQGEVAAPGARWMALLDVGPALAPGPPSSLDLLGGVKMPALALADKRKRVRTCPYSSQPFLRGHQPFALRFQCDCDFDCWCVCGRRYRGSRPAR